MAVCSAARSASRPSAASARPRDSYRRPAQWRSARRLDRQVSRALHRRGRIGRRLCDPYRRVARWRSVRRLYRQVGRAQHPRGRTTHIKRATQWRFARRLDRQVSPAQHRRGRIGRRLRDPYALAKPKLPRLSILRERVDAFAYVTGIAAIACEPHIDACSKSKSPR
ncbi:hypothetical protein EGY19_28495 [Burkholderia multivorans]|nr:hypothetical protein EGY19_28495 [Burkholderia multivorans]PRF47223.1 hypothetical protein C6Q04_18320 [Burkholderia multivorans]PRG44313.1 hypothetical protein C6T63_32630 [Burkholderia multivorans]